MYPWNVTETGEGQRIVLVHGSVSNGSSTWSAQAPLAERFRLVVPDRGGYWPNPPLERIDWAEQAREVAELLVPGTHLVGHSYGGVVALSAAGLRPDALRSLTLVEPPAFGLARGEPAVEELLSRLVPLLEDRARDTRAFLVEFLSAVGSGFVPPEELPRALAQGADALRVERPPWEAELPAPLEPPPFRCLVVSGGHSAAFDAVCDVLERRLGTERAVVPGAGHTVPRVGAAFNDVLARFVSG